MVFIPCFVGKWTNIDLIHIWQGKTVWREVATQLIPPPKIRVEFTFSQLHFMGHYVQCLDGQWNVSPVSYNVFSVGTNQGFETKLLPPLSFPAKYLLNLKIISLSHFELLPLMSVYCHKSVYEDTNIPFPPPPTQFIATDSRQLCTGAEWVR